MNGWGMNVTLKERLYSYLVHTRTYTPGYDRIACRFLFSMARQVSLYLPIKRNEVRLIKIKYTASTQTEKQTGLTNSFYYLSYT